MALQSCGFIGHVPSRFRFGWDEEDEFCTAMKLALLQQIQLFIKRGVRHFYTVCDPGVGLWCGELVNAARKQTPEVCLQCIVPHEECSTKWAPYLRERYFELLEACSGMEIVERDNLRLAQLKAYIQMINYADCLVAVYDPTSNRGDAVDQAMLYAAGRGRKILQLHPDTLEITIL